MTGLAPLAKPHPASNPWGRGGGPDKVVGFLCLFNSSCRQASLPPSLPPSSPLGHCLPRGWGRGRSVPGGPCGDVGPGQAARGRSSPDAPVPCSSPRAEPPPGSGPSPWSCEGSEVQPPVGSGEGWEAGGRKQRALWKGRLSLLHSLPASPPNSGGGENGSVRGNVLENRQRDSEPAPILKSFGTPGIHCHF